MSFKVIETFSGIGAQAKAFEKLQRKDKDVNVNVVATVEWDIGAMYAYDIIHHGKQNLSKYDNYTKDDLIKILTKFNLSSNGKIAVSKSTIKRMPLTQLKSIYCSIENNKNLIDISAVHANELPDADLLTYSFPCQDLSISSYWHQNFSGIDKNAHNRSGLLWEIERILKEYKVEGKKFPRFLLMENVSAIHSPRHNENFQLWQKELKELGYQSDWEDLNATNFGIPQNRTRTFMISVFVKDLTVKQQAEVQKFLQNWETNTVNETPKINDFLRLNYSNPMYRDEAIKSTTNNTESRRRIHADSVKLAYGKKPTENIAKTITTKQDRYPNAGIVIHESDFGEGKSKYRNLTPRETFLLMGFEENDFQQLIDNNEKITKSRKMISHSKLLKLSGNSIVVNVLEDIFEGVLKLNKKI